MSINIKWNNISNSYIVKIKNEKNQFIVSTSNWRRLLRRLKWQK